MHKTVICLLILLSLPALVSCQPTTKPPRKRHASCRLSQLWNIPKCYNEKSELSEAWLYAVMCVLVFCSTIFALMIYPHFDLGWNAVDAMNYPTFPAPDMIPLRQVVVPVALNQRPPSPTPTEVSYFNLTGGDD